MWLIRPKRLAPHNRQRIAFIIRRARTKARAFQAVNPSRNVGVRVVYVGREYRARCQYFDSFTGSPCTFDVAW